MLFFSCVEYGVNVYVKADIIDFMKFHVVNALPGRLAKLLNTRQ